LTVDHQQTCPPSVLDDLRTCDPETFVSTHIFDRVPHAFADDRTGYVTWKRLLAKGLGVDSADLTVVGSAATGISLNPYKNYRPYGDHSDIDVAVISSFHFQSAWRFLRQNGNLRARLSVKERASWDEHRTSLLFWGTIATDRLLPRFPFGAEWRAAIDAVQATVPMVQPIAVRVYNDYEALRTYQLNSVRMRQRDKLMDTGI
jgi:hypothetical protein